MDRTNVKGSVNVREALLSGDVSVYGDYTGTEFNHTDPIQDSQKPYDVVKAEDKRKNGVVCGQMAPATTRNRGGLPVHY